jgi:putative transposase
MPDHIHAILDVGSSNISEIIHNFKIRYSRYYRDRYSPGRVWQNRFWDHVIRDQSDLNSRLDYIHYNPVHHGLASDPHAYAHSSLGLWREKGFYARDWGTRRLSFEGDYGE